MRARILILAPRPCVPANTGAKLRNYHLAHQLSRRMDVTFLAFEEDGVKPGAGDLPPVCDRVILVPRPAGYRPSSLLKGLMGPDPITVVNYTTDEMRNKVRHLTGREHFDIVQVEGLPMTGYVPLLRAAERPPLIALDWHNVDSEVMRRYSESEASIARRLYARLTASRIEQAERRALAHLDAHISVSARDRAWMLQWAPQAPIHVIENGVDVDWYAQRATENESGRRVLFVGSMDYYANVDGVVWFAREVWPLVRGEHPDLIFTIVGRSPGAKVRELASLPGVEVTGTVNDVRPYYRDAVLSVVPLRSGGGSRLKILESMAAGVPVISTALGAEGLDVTDGRDILIANTAQDLAAALLRLYAQPAEALRLSEAALCLVRERYDWSKLGEALYSTYREMIDRRTAATSRA